MAFKTRKKMLSSILNELALVSGTDVQTYSEPIINDYIQRGFDHLFSKRFWDHLTTTTYHTLDGSAGVITDQLLNVEDVTDIKWIREEPYEPCDDIPYFSDGVFNTEELAFTALDFNNTLYEDKRVVFNPKTSTVDIAIRARRKPDDFEDGDVIPFDSLALVHFVTASVLAIDGMNPGAQARQDGLFNDRYETLVMNEASKPITKLSSRFSGDFTVA